MAPLHAAANASKSPAVIDALLDSGADPNARTEHDNAPLHLAADDHDSPSVIAALLDAGADIEARGYH